MVLTPIYIASSKSVNTSYSSNMLSENINPFSLIKPLIPHAIPHTTTPMDVKVSSGRHPGQRGRVKGRGSGVWSASPLHAGEREGESRDLLPPPHGIRAGTHHGMSHSPPSASGPSWNGSPWAPRCSAGLKI